MKLRPLSERLERLDVAAGTSEHRRTQADVVGHIKLGAVLGKSPKSAVPNGQGRFKRNQEGRRGWAGSSTHHHQEDGAASSLGHVSMGKGQCAVVVSSVINLMISFSNLKLWSRGEGW